MGKSRSEMTNNPIGTSPVLFHNKDLEKLMLEFFSSEEEMSEVNELNE